MSFALFVCNNITSSFIVVNSVCNVFTLEIVKLSAGRVIVPATVSPFCGFNSLLTIVL